MPHTRLGVEDYIEALRELGGEATTKALAEEVGRSRNAVCTVLGRRVKDREHDIPVQKYTVGDTHVYEYTGTDIDRGDAGDAHA